MELSSPTSPASVSSKRGRSSSPSSRCAGGPAQAARRPLLGCVPHVGRSQRTARTARASCAGVVSAKTDGNTGG
eukprot:7133304-Prymnesium_polylepis.1